MKRRVGRLLFTRRIPGTVWVTAGWQCPPRRGHWWHVRGIVRRHDFGLLWVAVMADRTTAEQMRLYRQSVEDDENEAERNR